MANKRLSLIILWLLVATNCQLIVGQTDPDAQQLQAPRPRGRIRIADMQMAKPSPPVAPPAMPIEAPINWPGYNPIIPGPVPVPGVITAPASSTVHTHIPLLREQPEDNQEASGIMPSEGRISEAVVYGNWKPEHPLKPDPNPIQPKKRVFGRLEAMLMGMPADAIEKRESPSEEQLPDQQQRTAAAGYHNPTTRRESVERSQEIRGRWRNVPKPISESQPEPELAIEVIRMNASDPRMRNMAKQINESIETTTMPRQASQTTEDNWMPLPYPYPTNSYESTQPVPGILPRLRSSSSQVPMASIESTTVALNWPTDFLDATSSSTERSMYRNAGQSIDRIDSDALDESDDYKYFDENLNSAQMHNELSIPDNVLPQLPLNITKVGIPYEERNSAEEPTICVPLTVTETATESATPLLVEVERIYCFPLPKVEIRMGSVKQQYPVEVEINTSSSEASIPTELTQPEQTAGASRQNFFALLLIMGNCILSRV